MSHRPFFRAVALMGSVALGAACGSGREDSSGPAPAATGSARSESALEAPAFEVVQKVGLSATEHDRMLGAAFDGQNRLYGAGWVASGADQMMAVARFRSDGAPDTGFGTNGVTTVNVAQGGKAAELARGVVVDSSGRVVISGTIEHDPSASGDAAKDTDIALARFDSNGRLDPTFGSGGVVKIDLSTGILDGTAYRADTAWGLTRLANDKLLVVGSQVGAGEGRKDADFAVLRLNPDGTRDTSFGSGGVALVGVAPNVSETPKTAVELPDGTTVVTGYANIGGIVKIVLFRLSPGGTLDPAFGTEGISVTQLLGSVSESYAVAVAGDRLVTTGYGRDTPDAKVDVLIGGFTRNGALDPSFGTSGFVRLDVAGDDDRGRNVLGLPDGGAVVVGSAKPSPANIDGMVVKLTPTGALDTTFDAGGRRLFDIGGPNDSFFGVALSPDKSRMAVVGYLGQETGSTAKDDSAVVWLEP